MSVRIIQIDIGAGTQWGDNDTATLLRKFFIPSVQQYAERHGYQYQLVTMSEYERTVGTFDFLASREKHYSFERYFHMAGDENQIVYIDNDVFISEHASSLPHVKGVGVAPEPEGNSADIFREVNGLSPSALYYNSGVTMVDTETSHDLQEYMLSRMRNLERARGKNTDNMMLNEYILKYPDKLFPLTSEWNYMPMLPDAPHLSKANFLHAVGINGKHVLTELVNQGLDLEILLQQLTEGFHIEFK